PASATNLDKSSGESRYPHCYRYRPLRMGLGLPREDDDSNSAPQHHQLLDLGDRLGRVEVFRAGLGAVQDRVAAVEAERVFQGVEPVAGLLITAVGDPAIGLQQHRRPEIALAAPPIGRTGWGTAEAQDAFTQRVVLF